MADAHITLSSCDNLHRPVKNSSKEQGKHLKCHPDLVELLAVKYCRGKSHFSLGL